MNHTDEQILRNMNAKDRKRVSRRIQFDQHVQDIRRLCEENDVSLADVSRGCGYAPYSLSSMISQTRTTGRLNMKAVTTALKWLQSMPEKTP